MNARAWVLIVAWCQAAPPSWSQGLGTSSTATTSPLGQQTQVARLLAGFEREPDVGAVQEAAARFVGAHPERVRSWRARVRHAAWLPELRVRVQKGYEDDLLATANGHSRATDDDLVFEVQARWRFDRLLFDRNELLVSREATLLADLRREVTAEVTRLYFQRRRLQVELRLRSEAPLRVHAQRVLRLQELTAEIDAMTGGFFRKALAAPPSTSAPKPQTRSQRRLP